MFLMFLSALILGVALFKLGVYSALVSIFAALFKVTLIVSGVVIAVYLYRRFGAKKANPAPAERSS